MPGANQRGGCAFNIVRNCVQACYDNPIFDDDGGKNFPSSPATQNGNSAITAAVAGAGGGKPGRGAGLGRKTTADIHEDGTPDGRYGASYHVANDYMHSLPSKMGSTPDEIIYRTKRRRSRCKLLLLAFAALLVMVVVVVLIAYLRGNDSHGPSFTVETSTQSAVISLLSLSGELTVIAGPFAAFSKRVEDYGSREFRLFADAFMYKMDSIVQSSHDDISRIYNRTNVIELREQNKTVQVRFVIHVNPGYTTPTDFEKKMKDVMIDGFKDTLFVINASSVFLKAREETKLITTTPKQDECLPVSLKECLDRPLNLSGYMYTSFPNILGHRSAAEAQEAASDPTKYRLLFETSCYALSDDFYCSLLEPQCGSHGRAIPPCRQYCIDVRAHCLPKYSAGQKFPIACNKLPDSDDPTVCRQNPYQPGVCVPVDVEHCSELGFNRTAFPNVLGEVSHDKEGKHGINSVLNIFVPTQCFKHAPMFVCAMHLPPCSGKPEPNHYIPPCRIMCEVFLQRCEIFFGIFSFEWHLKLNCSALPNSLDPEVCIGYKETLESESLECPEHHVKCNNNRCIHSSWLCDGYQDCDDNSDEKICASCGEEEMSCLPASGLCIKKSQGCDGRDDCYAGADETLCVRIDTDSEQNILLSHNSMTSAWEEVCKEGWTREYSDLTCKQLGYNRALSEAYVLLNDSSRQKSMIGSLKNGSDPTRIQSYLNKGFSTCASGYRVQVLCFEAVCGYRPAYFQSPARIVGGKEVKPGAWPWMASLNGGSGQKYFCGGTIIGPRWVLTAGHCVGSARKEDGKSWFIKTGTTRRLAFSETIQVRHPANFFVHPQFNISMINYDIALIQLDKPLYMNDFVRPVCLPKALPARGVRCIVTGWGKAKDTALLYEPVLREVGVDVTSIEYCRHAISRPQFQIPYTITDTMFCAGGSAGHDSCQGDSGGPLVCQMKAEESPKNVTTDEFNVLEDLLDAEAEMNDFDQLDEGPVPLPRSQPDYTNRWYQGGIVSWGVACGHPNLPAVYTNLPMFLDWIDEVVRNATNESLLD